MELPQPRPYGTQGILRKQICFFNFAFRILYILFHFRKQYQNFIDIHNSYSIDFFVMFYVFIHLLFSNCDNQSFLQEENQRMTFCHCTVIQLPNKIQDHLLKVFFFLLLILLLIFLNLKKKLTEI